MQHVFLTPRSSIKNEYKEPSDWPTLNTYLEPWSYWYYSQVILLRYAVELRQNQNCRLWQNSERNSELVVAALTETSCAVTNENQGRREYPNHRKHMKYLSKVLNFDFYLNLRSWALPELRILYICQNPRLCIFVELANFAINRKWHILRSLINVGVW